MRACIGGDFRSLATTGDLPYNEGPAPKSPATANPRLNPMVTILFDIDGTLIQTGGAGQIAFAETFSHLFGIDQISTAVGFAGRSDRAIAYELMQSHGLEPSDARWEQFVAAFVPRLVAVLPRCQGTVLPGVPELLDELAQHDHVSSGLLTGNIAAGAQAKLSRTTICGIGLRTADSATIGPTATTSPPRPWPLLAHTLSTPMAPATVCVAPRSRFRPPRRPRRGPGHRRYPRGITCARGFGAIAVAVQTGGATRANFAACEPDLLLTDLTDSAEILRYVASARA